jgi:hypothetical protein
MMKYINFEEFWFLKLVKCLLSWNTTYILLKINLGYMFRLVGVIIRPLQCNEAVRHQTIYCQTGSRVVYTYIYEIMVTDVIW